LTELNAHPKKEQVMDQENQIIDINTADVESLSDLQGVGTHLAQRIIEARPFTSIDDLTRVRGISEKDVERLRPFLHNISETSKESQVSEDIEGEALSDVSDETNELAETDSEPIEVADSDKDFSASDQEGASDELVEADIGESGDVDEIDSISEDQIPEADQFKSESDIEEDQEPFQEESEQLEEVHPEIAPSQPVFITRGGACGLVLIGGFITLILAVAVTLGIISSVNQGRLNYASPSQVAALQSQNEILSSQSKTLADDINSLRTRMDNLESLSGQVSVLETEISSLREEFDQLKIQVAANQSAYEELATQVETIEEELQALSIRGDRFESFLEGMNTLMEALFPQESQVEETP
jgi:ribosomal protein S13/FtsZ-binding cell division protein ZapB